MISATLEQQLQHFINELDTLENTLMRGEWESTAEKVDSWSQFIKACETEAETLDSTFIQSCLSVNERYMALIYPRYMRTQRELEGYQQQKFVSEKYKAF